MQKVEFVLSILLGILTCIICALILISTDLFSSRERVFERGEERSFYGYSVNYRDPPSNPCLVVKSWDNQVSADSCQDGGLRSDGSEKDFETPDDVTIVMSRVSEGEIRVVVNFHYLRIFWKKMREWKQG